jgi:hypothetical protein
MLLDGVQPTGVTLCFWILTTWYLAWGQLRL